MTEGGETSPSALARLVASLGGWFRRFSVGREPTTSARGENAWPEDVWPEDVAVTARHPAMVAIVGPAVTGEHR